MSTTETRPGVDRIAGAPISWGVCEVPGWGYQLTPERVLAATIPLVPTYVWVCFAEPSAPRGPALRVAPRHLS